MGNAEVFIVVFVVSLVVTSWVRRHRSGLVAERGLSIGADLGSLADKPRVRVRQVLRTGPDRVRLVLTPLGPPDGPPPIEPPDIDLAISLPSDDPGFDLLKEWEQSGLPLGIVMPPDTKIVRLRSLDDLQPLTLRRAD